MADDIVQRTVDKIEDHTFGISLITKASAFIPGAGEVVAVIASGAAAAVHGVGGLVRAGDDLAHGNIPALGADISAEGAAAGVALVPNFIANHTPGLKGLRQPGDKDKTMAQVVEARVHHHLDHVDPTSARNYQKPVDSGAVDVKDRDVRPGATPAVARGASGPSQSA